MLRSNWINAVKPSKDTNETNNIPLYNVIDANNMKPEIYIPCQEEFNRGYVTQDDTTGLVYAECTAYYINGKKHGPAEWVTTKSTGEKRVFKNATYVNDELHGKITRPTNAPGYGGSVRTTEYWYHGVPMGRRIATSKYRRREMFVVSYYNKHKGRCEDVVTLDDMPEFHWNSVEEFTETDLFTLDLMGIFRPEAMAILTDIVKNPLPTHYISR